MPAPVQQLLTHDPQHLYNGWVRVDRGVWLVCTSAPTAGACWDAMLWMPPAGQHAERCVLRAGDSPEKKPRARR